MPTLKKSAGPRVGGGLENLLGLFAGGMPKLKKSAGPRQAAAASSSNSNSAGLQIPQLRKTNKGSRKLPQAPAAAAEPQGFAFKLRSTGDRTESGRATPKSSGNRWQAAAKSAVRRSKPAIAIAEGNSDDDSSDGADFGFDVQQAHTHHKKTTTSQAQSSGPTANNTRSASPRMPSSNAPVTGSPSPSTGSGSNGGGRSPQHTTPEAVAPTPQPSVSAGNAGSPPPSHGILVGGSVDGNPVRGELSSDSAFAVDKFFTGSDTEVDEGPDNANFWEPGGEKTALKRLEHGNVVCTDLQKMMKQRADIEKHYAKELEKWSEKWSGWTHQLDRQYKQTTVMDALAKSIGATKILAGHHKHMRNKLEMTIQDRFKHFKVAHPTSKLKKEAKKLFGAARSPWEKKKKEVESTRVKHEKANKSKTRQKLENAIAKLRSHEKDFRTAASFAFDKLQDEERIRSEFMKEVLLEYDAATNVVNLHQADSDAVSASIQAISTDQDLATFHDFYGTGQDLTMPNDHGIWPSEDTEMSRSRTSTMPGKSALARAHSPGASRREVPSALASAHSPGTSRREVPKKASVQFDMGQQIALYAYTADNADELSLVQGELLTTIEDTEDGWITVRNQSGEEGIVPATYVGPDNGSNA